MQLTSINSLLSWGNIDPELDLVCLPSIQNPPPPSNHPLQQPTIHKKKSETTNYPQYLQANPVVKSNYVNTPIMQLRAQAEKLETASFNALPSLGINETVIKIPMSDGTESMIRICRPAKDTNVASTSTSKEDENAQHDTDSDRSEQELTPLIALFHGGGFVVGSNLQMAIFARVFATLYKVTVASMSYRLAPEHPFPTAQNDAWDGIRWLSSPTNAALLGANLTLGFIVGGVSAGGNLAISVTHRSILSPLASPITGLWTAIPPTTNENGSSIPEEALSSWISRAQNADAPCLSFQDLVYLQSLLHVDPMSGVYSPFMDLCTFPALPALYVQVAGMDPLRDDGLVYEAVAREMGAQTRVDVYGGMPHGFFYYFPRLKQSVRFLVDVVRNMGWLLGREGEMDEERVVGVLGKMGSGGGSS
ncbi:non-cytosolic lipase-like A protein [Aspergillus affinis]|uniref:non-cytosolic lipase-like A protein n=1 Tax=Aspergillus affinis TaxID=1070780 RepID=UPI0022FEB58D|nr:non-cytosolic lipase-like A protein [Aspergillus affinis]KAI9039836.1 non-cytosolic lipase-like A protein [Aspergillus affinis]